MLPLLPVLSQPVSVMKQLGPEVQYTPPALFC